MTHKVIHQYGHVSKQVASFDDLGDATEFLFSFAAKAENAGYEVRYLNNCVEVKDQHTNSKESVFLK